MESKIVKNGELAKEMNKLDVQFLKKRLTHADIITILAQYSVRMSSIRQYEFNKKLRERGGQNGEKD